MLKLVTLTVAGLGFIAAQSDVPASSTIPTTESLTALSFGSCKTLPGDRGWPKELEWAALNKTVNGNLIKYRPPGAVCAKSTGLYSEETCAGVRAAYTTRNFTQNDPGAIEALWYTGLRYSWHNQEQLFADCFQEIPAPLRRIRI